MIVLPLIWRPLPERAQNRLRDVLCSWEGTPYGIGQCAKGAGVDCVRFIVATLWEMDGKWAPGAVDTLRTLPSDASLHARGSAVAGMKAIARALEPIGPVGKGLVVQPGDILVVGPETGGPGHGIIVGPDASTLWEAGSRCVQKIGCGLPDGIELFAIWRKTNKGSW